MLKIACNKCKNCTGKECRIYESDANESIKKCTSDGFKNYTGRKITYQGIDMAVVAETKNVMCAIGINNKSN